MKKIAKTGKKRDVNQLAAAIVEAATNAQPPDLPVPPDPMKNPAAVALGRLGGQKGGKARAASLSAKRRSAIARKGARALWKKRQMKTDSND